MFQFQFQFQSLSYYPFGLTIDGFTQELNPNFPRQAYKYNGKEELLEGIYDYGARMYDPATARWASVDPLASDMPNWSPYNYTFNNPIRFIDPDGKCPWCIGGIIGGLTDYGLQVTGNFIQGKTGLDAFTDVNKTSIATSAVAGAAGVGIISRIKDAKNLATKTKVALEMTTDGVLNVGQQALNKGEVDLTETAVAATAGTVFRGKTQDAIHSSAAKKGQKLAKETNTAQRKAQNAVQNSSREGKIKQKKAIANAKKQEMQHHQNVTDRKAAAGGVVSSGVIVKTVNLNKNNDN
ncbi:MAG: RHS repeat domain-containing protein [Chitinophagales bacterium]